VASIKIAATSRLRGKRCDSLPGAATLANIVLGDSRRLDTIASDSVGLVVHKPPVLEQG